MFNILKNKTFLMFFIGNIISLIGFGINIIAISWLVLEKTNSELSLGIIMATSTAPGVFLALFAGIIIDKLNRKFLLIFLDIFRMIILIVFILILYLKQFEIFFLYPLAIFMGLGNSLFWPTAQAFVQELVKENEYFSANALLSASYQVGSILGSGIGGLIVYLYDPIVALWINAMAYLFSAIFIFFAPFKKEFISNNTENIQKSVFRGFQFLKNKKPILVLGLSTILADVAIWGSLSVLTITISKTVFNAATWGYSIMEGFYGIGALISTILIIKAVAFIGRVRSLLLFYLIAGLMCYMIPFSFSIFIAGIAYFLMGLTNNSARIIIRTIFMERIPNKIMGRVQTIFGVYTRLMVITSSLFAGWLVEFGSIRNAMLFSSSHYIIAFIGTLFVSQSYIRNNLFVDKSLRENA